MKHIKLRILLVIWISVLLLFGAFSLVLNISLPLHFENQARNALTYEINHMEQIRKSKKDDLSDVDEYVGTYFSGEIKFIELYNEEALADSYADTGENNVTYKENIQAAEIEILSFEKENQLKNKKCYSFSTQNGYYIVARYDGAFSSDGRKIKTLMYINIQPVVQYSRSLNIVLAAFFLCISAVMTVIGLDLGKKIVQTQDTQRRFFQNSSHELRTPLMSIQGYAEAIETGVVDPVPSAEIILQESDRMSALVDEILAISKIDAHQVVLSLAVTDVREILYDCLRTLEPIMKKQNTKLSLRFSQAPVHVNCDEERLSRAFTNVLSNALRHCRGTVAVMCKVKGKNCVIRIADNGKGISEKDLPHIFDRFYTGRDGNTGIGLALTDEIIRLHKGTISAQNIRSGAVFEIKLPLA